MSATGYVLPDFATSGSIGSAATTVDVYSRININQITASINLTLPDPTNTSTKVTEVWVGNIGTVSFSLEGNDVDVDKAFIFKWVGSKWCVVGGASVDISNKQDKPIVVTANITAVNDEVYNVAGTSVFTDPTPVAGKGYTVNVLEGGSATVGGTVYAVAGTVIRRYYDGGTWSNYVPSAGSSFDPAVDTLSALSPVNSPILATDTIDEFAGKTQGQIDALNLLGDKVGVLFEDDFSTNTIANYTITGAGTFTVSSGVLNVGNGAGDFTRYAEYNLKKVNSEKLNLNIRFVVGTLNQRGVYFGLGAAIALQFGLNMTTSATSVFEVIGYYDSSVGTKSFDSQIGDVIDITYTQDGFDGFFICKNNRSKETITFEAKGANYNTGLFRIYSVAGANTVDSYSVVDTNTNDISLIGLGDSIMRMNTYFPDINLTWPRLVQNAFNGFIKLAGGGDQIDTSAAYLSMVASYPADAEILLQLGSNNASNVGTFQTAHRALVTALESAGRTVHICTILDRSGLTANINTINTWIYTEYGATNTIVDVNKVIDMSLTANSSDYTHPTTIQSNDILGDFYCTALSPILNQSKNLIRNSTVYSKDITYLDNMRGSLQVATAALVNTDTTINFASKPNWPYAGYALIQDASTGAMEYVRYYSSTATSIGNIQRAKFGTTAISIASAANVRVMPVTRIVADSETSTPTFAEFPNGKIMFGANAQASYQDKHSFQQGGSDRFTIRSSGSATILYQKAASTDVFLTQWQALVGGTTYRMTHQADDTWTLGTSSFINGVCITPVGNTGIQSSTTTFRNTNGGSDVVSRVMIDPARSLTTGVKWGFDVTNGFYCAQGNGTRIVAGASIRPINLTSTAGSEVMDLGIYTQSAGATMALRITIGSSAMTLIEAYDIILGTTTGTKIGTSVSQKIGFWNATPVVQQTGGAATAGIAYTATEQGMLNTLYSMARTTGLLS